MADLYAELRSLTRLYMQKHLLSLMAMAIRLDLSYSAVRHWVYRDGNFSVLAPAGMERLIELFRAEGWMKKSILIPAAIAQARASILAAEAEIGRKKRRGRPLRALGMRMPRKGKYEGTFNKRTVGYTDSAFR